MTQTYGYRAGMKQVSLAVNLSVKRLEKIDLSRLDRWLGDHFATEVPALDAVLDARLSPALSLSPVPGLLARVLAIYGLLCRASELPCLDAGRLLRLETKADQWQLALLLPAVNGLPPRVFTELAQHALRLANAFMRTAPSAEQAQRYYGDIDTKMLPIYRRLLPDGRANAFVAGLAHKLGVPFEHLGMGLMQLGHGARAQTTLRSACREDSAMGARFCSDKHSTALLLAQAGLPVPAHALVSSAEGALAVAQRLGWPVVVKPADRERGEGVSIDVADAASLAAAFEKARALSSRVLVEQQVRGLCHRIFIAGGRLVYALRRWPKSVKGDGVKTVQQLVEDANAAQLQTPPWLRKKPFLLDDLGLACLAKSGLGPHTVLPEGQVAPLRPIPTTEWGGEPDDVTQTIHADNVRLAVQAASAMGLSVVGVDLMTDDITRPWHETGAVINELNFTPYLGGNLANEKVHPYLHALVQADGRIPVHAVVGAGDLWAKGRVVRDALAAQGIRAHLCATDNAESPDGGAEHLACKGLFLRCTALLRRRDVDALIVLVDSPEFLNTGLPLDRFSAVHVVGDPMTSAALPLLDLLSRHVMEARP
jgi:cyanophycin synthetase